MAWAGVVISGRPRAVIRGKGPQSEADLGVHTGFAG